ncbi:MAG: nucleotide exchange factor GrpE [Prevotella sp.]|nr:nucleotide exchange factor GrpE [Prevotella sp.]
MSKDNENINEEIQEEVNDTPETELEVEETEESQETEEDTKAPEEKADTAEEEKDPLEVAQAKIAELNDALLRKMAEFENYRKRTVKEKAELILNGGEKTVTKILPVIDDMERAIENGKKTDDVEALREGMDLIYKKFIKTLEGMGVKRIETEGQDFDTDYHEAIAMVPGMGDDKKGKVIDCVQTGYTMNDKVIRFAKVAVGQ